MKTYTKISLKIVTLTVLLTALDQFIKYLASISFRLPYSIIGNFFQLHYTQNTGIAFGIPIPQIVLIIITTLLVLVLIYVATQELNLRTKLSQITVSLVLAGGIGNLIDRVFRGYVVDFISIWKYPTFNLADIYIVVGILLIVVFYGKIKRV